MAFATETDVATRLGRDLSVVEEDQVSLLLDLATAVIASAAGKSEDWAEALDPVPVRLKGFCIEIVCRSLGNPNGLFSRSETVGSYSYSESFNREIAGLSLTAMEKQVIRRAVGNLTYEVRTPSATEQFLEDLVAVEGS